MELILIEPNSPEWDFMWNWLASHPINAGLEDPSTAQFGEEAWQYMGTYKQDDRIIHTFRHRNHPVTQTIKNLSVSGSPEFTQEQIKKKFRL